MCSKICQQISRSVMRAHWTRTTGRWTGAYALALALVVAGPAPAATVVPKTLEEMVVEADLVAVAQVLDVQAHPTADNNYAYTYVTLGHLDISHGQYTDPTLTLRMDGGPVGNGQFVHIVGMPRFEKGEKVVVFVKGNTHRINPIVGWHQGMLRVVRDQKSNREVLKTHDHRTIHGIEQGDLVAEPDVHALSRDATAGVPDYGPNHELEENERAQRRRELNLQFTVDDLKKEVSAVRARKGLGNRAMTTPLSARVTLDAPPARQPRQFKHVKEGN